MSGVPTRSPATSATEGPSPAEQLAILLRAARQADKTWRTAWRESWVQLVFPDNENETKHWVAALSGTRKAWRSAYEHPEHQPVWANAILHPPERSDDDWTVEEIIAA